MKKKVAYRIPLRHKETGQSITISVFQPEEELNA